MIARRLFGCLFALCAANAPNAVVADDGLRAVNVERYGIAVRVPQAWELIDWATDEKAFVLRLPQEDESPVGYVACELGVAPEDLSDFRDRQQASDEAERQKETPERTLIQNEIEPIDAARYGEEAAARLGSRLVSIWVHETDSAGRWFEHQLQVISDDTLYTFVLASDEAHYEAYRIDFEDMLAKAKFTPPQTGLQKLPGGYWMQREFRFALRLPEAWRPAFAPEDKVLFFATGTAHDVFTDNLLVLATRAEPLDLSELKKTLPDDIRQADPQAEIASCEVVAQGDRGALETVVHTRRGPFQVTVLERRFRGQDRNYELKYTCETAEFEKIQAELRKSLDTFIEAPAGKAGKQVL